MKKAITTSTPGRSGKAAGEPFAVAATPDFEARPAVAYDANRRLWFAWEQSGPAWGKDYGMKASAAKKGTFLYDGDLRLVVRVLDRGQWYEVPGDLDAVWPRKPQTNRVELLRGNRVSFGRMGVDRQGRVWLSGRVWMGPSLSNSWYEYVTCPGPTAGCRQRSPSVGSGWPSGVRLLPRQRRCGVRRYDVRTCGQLSRP